MSRVVLKASKPRVEVPADLVQVRTPLHLKISCSLCFLRENGRARASPRRWHLTVLILLGQSPNHKIPYLTLIPKSIKFITKDCHTEGWHSSIQIETRGYTSRCDGK